VLPRLLFELVSVRHARRVLRQVHRRAPGVASEETVD
jgi:hypothetical protein